MSSTGAVQVVVRLRPLNERELKASTLPVVSASTNDKTVSVIRGTGSSQKRSQFAFDNVFTAFSTQEEVFETTLKPVIKDVLKGFESTVFAYGQTGTGKTHTMEGSLDHPDNYGVIPRAAEAIFNELNNDNLNYVSYQVFCSYLEIYNEELCDLLTESTPHSASSSSSGAGNRTPRRNASNNSSSGVQQKLEIMEGKHGPFCRGLSEKEVATSADLLSLMEKAQQQRRVGETNMNKQSSRSHCIFTLRVEAKRRLEDGALFETRGKLHMVDLAGSECAKTADMDDKGSQQAARERERMNINRSLLTLGRVVKLLKEQSSKSKPGNVRIPYRDSKLTRILQQALGGNSKTVIFATLSPSVTAIEESVSTLNYAQAAHGIINKPVSASYLSEATKASSMLSGMDSAGSSGAQSIEQWKEMEVRLEYMKCQVEEAKAALARKHMQQQEFVERAETAEAEKTKIEDKLIMMTQRASTLEGQLAEAEGRLEETEQQLKETRTLLDKTTLVLEATQKTEDSLTREALALIEALKESVADGDQLHTLLVTSLEADATRRQAAKQFNFSMAALLADVKEALDALAQQEISHHVQTTELATTAASKDLIFLEKAKEVLQTAVANVESAVTSLKATINEDDGIVPSATSCATDTVTRIGNARSILQQSEQTLVEQLKSTRGTIGDFGNKLTELEKQHLSCSSDALAALESNVAKSKQKVEELVFSSNAVMHTAMEERKTIRDATRNTVELWKQSMIDSGEVILRQSTTQRGAVEETSQMMATEMQRHANIEQQLKSQESLLENSQTASTAKHEAQKELLLKTQGKAEECHKQQSDLLSVFVPNLMKDVESLVSKKVLEVMEEVKKGHTAFLENNFYLMENHSNITTSTLETFVEAGALTSSLQKEAEAAKQTDTSVIAHLGETKSVFADIEEAVAAHQSNVDDFSAQSVNHLKESEDLEAKALDLCERLSAGGKDCSEFITTNVFNATSDDMSTLTNAGTAIVTFTNDDVLPTMSSALETIEEPRSAAMSSMAQEFSGLEKCIDLGMTRIKVKSSVACRMAEKLQQGMEAAETDFSSTTIEERRKDIAETKDSFLSFSDEHAEFASGSISRSGEGSTKAASTSETFVKTDLAAFEPVEAAPERVHIPYSDQLSRTPNEETILKRVGGGLGGGRVLQSLNPNHENGGSGNNNNLKAHRAPGGHATMPNSFGHERNEPRSETLA
ncbi:Kinesin-like protein KIN [Seminavis robusta]|uniref:Kinesin-like protein KIN n=1 Tax=Seminavis robusta TaxID=568900 RepID=A0A9N8DTF6_9STRA|nr:Kinesin-like protein KIN [Seminavis robusta]|eukprot:Sro328_g118690.1 Kinesin-like protein KIN (1212) ;mRNA; r:48399-52269